MSSSGLLTQEQEEALAARPLNDPYSIPSPITGWNTRDALTSMAPTDALVLNNWYPDYAGCSLRNGYVAYTDSPLSSSPVKMLAEFWSGSTHKFLAASGGKVFDITNPASVATLGTGFTSDAWQTCMFGQNMFLGNGSDTAQIFNGTTLSATGITGPVMNAVNGFFVYQNFLILWTTNSTGFWYLPGLSISGAASFFDLSTISELGGNLLGVTSFSYDGGNGPLSLVCFVMTSGEVIIYSGTNPSIATDWGLVGKYRIGVPINIRSMARYGGETYLTTADDHVPLMQQLVSQKIGTLPPRSKATGAVAAAVAANPNGFGWQSLYYPLGRRVIFNIPNPNGTFYQHILNTATQAWTQFQGMNAYCWGIFNGGLYFGDASGNVWQADTGALDAGVQAISATGQTAWSLFTEELLKRVPQTRVIMSVAASTSYGLAIGFDYQNPINPTTITVTANNAMWNVALWNVSFWAGSENIDVSWRGGGGVGQAVSFLVIASSTVPMTWLRNDLQIEPGSTQ